MRVMEEMNQNRLGVYRQGNTLFFFDEIDSYSVSEALRLLQLICSQSTKKKVQPIQIILNTPGGCVYSGLCLYDYLRSLECPLLVIGTGLVASMGIIILLAGEKRCVTKNTRLMTHQVSTAIQGKVSDVKIDFNETNELEKICLGIIAERTGQSIKTLEKESKMGDKYFGASEALKRKYIHKII